MQYFWLIYVSFTYDFGNLYPLYWILLEVPLHCLLMGPGLLLFINILNCNSKIWIWPVVNRSTIILSYLLITMNGGCGAIQKASCKTKPLYPNHSFKTVQFLKNYRCSSIFTPFHDFVSSNMASTHAQTSCEFDPD